MKILAFLLTVLFAITGWAQPITHAQALTLKADTTAKCAVGQPLAGRCVAQDWGAVAAFYNTITAPDYIVWRSSTPVSEILNDPAFDWTRVDNLSVGKARIWEWMSAQQTLTCSQANIRAGIAAAWVGTAADLAVQATVLAHCKRQGSVVEKLFGTGLGTTVSPATMGLEGPVTEQEISDVMGGLL